MDITNICTPIDPDKLKFLLEEANYDKVKTRFLVDGFKFGFDIGYRGPQNRQDLADNLPIRVGSKAEIWSKICKEVELGRVAGPFTQPPYDNYIQSPIGLVLKLGGQTRLIFHLSFDFDEDQHKSFNYCTPDEMCSVKYRDLDHAIANCIALLEQSGGTAVIYFAKSDLSSAFRQLPGRPDQYKWLIMKAENPTDGKIYFFVDKCLPFGASISCALFQRFLDALHHIIEFKTKTKSVTNYLDDFLFLSFFRQFCDYMVREFLKVCNFIGCPVSEEKTEWSTTVICFLGMLLDGERKIIAIPEEKRIKALNILNRMINKPKATVKDIQCLTGVLNFLTRAIVPGRAFTWQMYAKLTTKNRAGKPLKHYHHVRLDREFREDCLVWKLFLSNSNLSVLCRPFIDLNIFETSQTLNFFTDASKGIGKGFGCVFGSKYTWGQWDIDFLKNEDPSIEYLELYALCTGVFCWAKELSNMRIVIFCDNQAVVHMVNNTSSSCKNCMFLIRKLVLDGLYFNRRVSVRYVNTKLKTNWTVYRECNLIDFSNCHHCQRTLSQHRFPPTSGRHPKSGSAETV